MEPKIAEIAERIRTLRDIMEFSPEEMAECAEVTVEEYADYEAGNRDFPFTFLYRCAEKFGVDMIELLTGEPPHLSGYTVTRGGDGLPIKRRAGFEYYHLAAKFKKKSCEPFRVVAPYQAGNETDEIHLSRHKGQEFDFILKGSLRFAHGTHEEILNPGDSVFYDSGEGHGMVAVSPEGCEFLAVVLKDREN